MHGHFLVIVRYTTKYTHTYRESTYHFIMMINNKIIAVYDCKIKKLGVIFGKYTYLTIHFWIKIHVFIIFLELFWILIFTKK